MDSTNPQRARKDMKVVSNILLTVIVCNLLWIVFCSIEEPDRSVDLESYEWQLSSPEQQGLDSSILVKAFEEAEKMGFVNSLVVVRNGYLVAEEYYHSFNKNSMTLVFSVTKSLVSALVGIALEENTIDSLDQKALDFFPEYVNQNMDPRKHDITIRHLLTMKAGFDADQNVAHLLANSYNMIEAIIGLPILFQPGEGFCYTSYGVHLLSGIITKKTGTSTLEFAKRTLLRPLGIDTFAWETDQNGISFGGGGMYLTPRDMARFGYLYLQKGLLDGKQIIPTEWIEESVRDYLGENYTWCGIEEVGYGYLWWTGRMSTHRIYFASGVAGQFIINIPDLNMVVVTTADAENANAEGQPNAIIELILDYILPAVRE